MVPRPVQPATERERLTCWRRFLRRASVAMTRPHRNMRHLPKEAWFQLLCAAQAPQDCINAAKHCRCQVCDNTKQKLPTHTQCHRNVFEYLTTIDVFEVPDATGKRFSSAVCMEPLLFKPGSSESPSFSAVHLLRSV